MSSISLLLYEYLMREQKLVLPSVGEISLRSSAPELNLEQGIFRPRRYQYAFREEGSATGLEELEDFVAYKLGCQLSEAAEVIRAWVAKIQLHCTDTKPYKWLDIGEFAHNKQHRLVFHPLAEYFSFWQEVLFIRNTAQVNRSNSKDYHSSSYTDERYAESETAPTQSAPTQSAPTKSIASTSVATEPTPTEDSVVPAQAPEAAQSVNTAEDLDIAHSSKRGTDQESSQHAEAVPRSQAPQTVEQPTWEDSPMDNRGRRVYTEFVELDAPERYGILHKVFIIILILAGFMYIFLHLFLNDFSFHSYVR